MAVTNHYIKIHTRQAEQALDRLALKSSTVNQKMMMGFVGVKRAAGGVTSMFKTIGIAAGVAGAAVAGGFAIGVMAIGSFEQSLRRIAAVGGPEFEAHLDDITDKVNTLAINYGVAQAEIAGGMVELVKTGFDYAESMATIESATQLTVGQQMDFAGAIEVTRGIMKAWQLDAEEMPFMMDKIAFVADKTAIDMDDFADSLKHVASSAHAAGLTATETAAILGVMSDAFVKPTKGARGLAISMESLAKNEDEVNQALTSMGFATVDVFGPEGQLNIMEVIQQVAALNLSYEEQTEVLDFLTQRGLVAWRALFTGAESLVDILGVVEGALGRNEEIADKMALTIPQMMERVKAAFVAGIGGAEFETVDGEILAKGGIESMNEFRDGMQDLLEAIIPLAAEFGRFIMSLLPMLPGLLEAIIPLLTTLMETFSDKGLIEDLVEVLETLLGILKFIAPHLPILIKLFILWKVATAAHTIAMGLHSAAVALGIVRMGSMATFMKGVLIPTQWAYFAAVTASLLAVGAIAFAFHKLETGAAAIVSILGIVIGLMVALAAKTWLAASGMSALTWGAAAAAGAIAIGTAFAMATGFEKKAQADVGKYKTGTYAEGFEGMMTEPTLALIAEEGPEYVSIRPQGQGGGGAYYNMSTNNFYESNRSKFMQNSKKLGGRR